MNRNAVINESDRQYVKTLYPGQMGFTLKLKVLKKSDIRTYNNKKGGESKMFSVDFIDEYGDFIPAVAFDGSEQLHP